MLAWLQLLLLPCWLPGCASAAPERPCPGLQLKERPLVPMVAGTGCGMDAAELQRPSVALQKHKYRRPCQCKHCFGAFVQSHCTASGTTTDQHLQVHVLVTLALLFPGVTLCIRTTLGLTCRPCTQCRCEVHGGWQQPRPCHVQQALGRLLVQRLNGCGRQVTKSSCSGDGVVRCNATGCGGGGDGSWVGRAAACRGAGRLCCWRLWLRWVCLRNAVFLASENAHHSSSAS